MSLEKYTALFTTRRMISLVLLCLFACLQTAPVIYSHFIHAHQANQLKLHQTNKQLVLLNFTFDEWQQVDKKNAHEIEWHGKMFDIKKLLFTDDKVSVIGYFDEKEDQLNQTAKRAEKKDQSTTKQVSFSNLLFYEEHTTIRFFNHCEEKALFVYIAERPTQSFLQHDSPPPKFLNDLLV